MQPTLSTYRLVLNNETVTARPPSKMYRFHKLVRRNKMVFASVALVAAALVIGLALSTWMFFKERDARQIAVGAQKKAIAEAQKNGVMVQLLMDMLQRIGPSVARGRDTTIMRDILDKTAERISIVMKDQPEAGTELSSGLVKLFAAYGDMLRNENKLAEAESFYREGLTICREVVPNDFELRQWLTAGLAAVLQKQGKPAEAEMYYREAVENSAKVWPNDVARWRGQVDGLVDVLQKQGKNANAEEIINDALAKK